MVRTIGGIVFVSLMAVYFVWTIVATYRQGYVRGRSFKPSYPREDYPISFWMYLFVNALGASCCAIVAGAMIVHLVKISE